MNAQNKTVIWRPEEPSREALNMAQFAAVVSDRHGRDVDNYQKLHAWSIDDIGSFWSEVWDFCGVVGYKGDRVLVPAERMQDTHFFPDARLNFAENLLRRKDASDAIVFRDETGTSRNVTWRDLYEDVSRLQKALVDLGVEPGDRIAAFMPNVPETVVAMLAATSLGAIWSSCSPDFGEEGVIDRFGQIEPKFLFACDVYSYGGKPFNVTSKAAAIAAGLGSVQSLIVVGRCEEKPDEKVVRGRYAVHTYANLLSRYPADEVTFEQLPFSHPLYILYSSGTTGKPKCIVHSAGGTLLQHLKEHQLHMDIHPGERLFYFTTCTWMMWNWLVSALASEASIALYDGSPFHPDGNVLFDYAAEEGITHFGVSAKFLESVRKAQLEPLRTHDLSHVRVVASTGSPLAPESFDYVYEHVSEKAYLASICGGTDIISGFITGDPSSPLHRGEIACAGLGMAVEVWNADGNAVVGEKGELVCTKPFPAMPIGFWKDASGKKYSDAYFSRFENVWTQGDYIEETANGGFIVYGRSDTTLNPGGVRIGTAEIYRQVEKLDEILASVVIGQPWEDDVRVVLFVMLQNEALLDDELRKTIRDSIRTGASPRHVPARIVQVDEVPMTKSGKIAEVAVRDVVEGREVANITALANPDSLRCFENLAELAG